VYWLYIRYHLYSFATSTILGSQMQ